MEEMQREVMSVLEAAEYLGVSESKLRELLRRRAIPYSKIDGQYKLFLPVIQEWLRGMTVFPEKPTSGTASPNSTVNEIWDKIEGVQK
jgi:excisionase family DNA binding protein